MNSDEQKTRAGALNFLAHRQSKLEETAADALDAAAQSIKGVAEVAKELVDSERYDRLMMKMELEDALRDVLEELHKFTRMSGLARLRWVLTGKL